MTCHNYVASIKFIQKPADPVIKRNQRGVQPTCKFVSAQLLKSMGTQFEFFRIHGTQLIVRLYFDVKKHTFPFRVAESIVHVLIVGKKVTIINS